MWRISDMWRILDFLLYMLFKHLLEFALFLLSKLKQGGTFIINHMPFLPVQGLYRVGYIFFGIQWHLRTMDNKHSDACNYLPPY